MVKGNYIYMGALRHKVDKALKLHSMNAMDMASEIAAPTLAIHNKDDEAVPCSQSAKFMVGIKSIYKKLITPEKGGHVFGDYELRMRVAEEVTEWLKAHVQ